MKKEKPLYRQRMPKLKMKAEMTEPMTLREAVALPGIGLTIPVRAAKAKLSALLEMVAGGQEVTITSDGRPKARLVSVISPKPRKLFQGMGDYLLKQPVHRGSSADEIIRAERDSRP